MWRLKRTCHNRRRTDSTHLSASRIISQQQLHFIQSAGKIVARALGAYLMRTWWRLLTREEDIAVCSVQSGQFGLLLLLLLRVRANCEQ
jgi:hypothetical protein